MKALVIFFGLAALAVGKQLPTFIPTCKRTDPDFTGCIKKALTTIQPYLAKGIKELNIPPIEPLVVPMISLEQGTGAVNYKATLRDIKITGLSKYKLQQLMVDFFKMKKFLAKVDLPVINLAADYNIGGNVLVLPIQGKGEMTANLTQCKADIMIVGEFVEKKGKEYLQAKEVKTRLYFGKVKAHFGNLFNGDSVLGMTTNNFLNENAKDILEEIKPAIEAVTNMLAEDIVNKIFRSVPVDQLFPE